MIANGPCAHGNRSYDLGAILAQGIYYPLSLWHLFPTLRHSLLTSLEKGCNFKHSFKVLTSNTCHNKEQHAHGSRPGHSQGRDRCAFLNYARNMQGKPWHVPLQMQGKPLHSPQNRGFEEDSIHDIYYIMNFRNRAGRMPGTIHSGSHVQLTGIPPQTHATSRVL